MHIDHVTLYGFQITVTNRADASLTSSDIVMLKTENPPLRAAVVGGDRALSLNRAAAMDAYLSFDPAVTGCEQAPCPACCSNLTFAWTCAVTTDGGQTTQACPGRLLCMFKPSLGSLSVCCSRLSLLTHV